MYKVITFLLQRSRDAETPLSARTIDINVNQSYDSKLNIHRAEHEVKKFNYNKPKPAKTTVSIIIV